MALSKSVSRKKHSLSESLSRNFNANTESHVKFLASGSNTTSIFGHLADNQGNFLHDFYAEAPTFNLYSKNALIHFLHRGR